MTRARAALSVSPSYLQNCPVYLLLRNEVIVGFFGFIAEAGETLLNDFWLEPALKGNGFGRLMWQHALEQARVHGYRSFSIQSDPNAEGFYLRMGARRAGARFAPETGRVLPLLEYDMHE